MLLQTYLTLIYFKIPRIANFDMKSSVVEHLRVLRMQK